MRVFLFSLVFICVIHYSIESESVSEDKYENGNENNKVEKTNEKEINIANKKKIESEDEKLEREFLRKRLLSSSFKDVAAERAIIDKSYLIKELFKTTSKVVLLTRPPKWGKSLTLDMVKSFLNLEVDEMGNKVPRDELKMPQLFHGAYIGEDINYKRLQISKSIVCKKMCEYPVIYLDLAGIDGFNESQITWAVYDKIDEVFQTQFPHLNETSFLYHLDDDNELKNRFRRYSERGTVEYGEYKKSLAFLSSVLFQAYGNQVVILIDNFDKSLLDLYLKYGPNHDSSITLRKCLSDLLRKSLKHNPKLRKAIVMGVFPSAKYDIMSKIDVLDCNIYNDYFGQYFGLTENDVFNLLQSHSANKIDKILKFYSGYTHANRTKLANPYSIMNVYINNGTIKPYWADKSDVEVFHKALKTYYKHDYKTLMSGKTIKNIYLSQKLNLAELIEPENLLEMLIYNGYLTARPSDVKNVALQKPEGVTGSNITYTSITYHNVSIPSQEILYSFHKVIKKEKLKKQIKIEEETNKNKLKKKQTKTN